jgi:putative phosphoribosyl transferase
MEPPFPDRQSAGRALGARLAHLAGRSDTIVLGLPRGGLPVAAEVASALNAPLDIVLVRKIGTPMNPELALGAIAGPEGKTLVLNADLVNALGIGDAEIHARAAPERKELARRRMLWGSRLQAGALAGKVVILVDDGIATGATMRAAIAAVRADGPLRIVVAAPVAAPDTLEVLSALADEVVCLAAPALFTAVGVHYLQFAQVSDDEVRDILSAAGSVPAPVRGQT